MSLWKTDEGSALTAGCWFLEVKYSSLNNHVLASIINEVYLGQKFKALLQQHGTFGNVELALKRWKLKMKKLKKSGGWNHKTLSKAVLVGGVPCTAFTSIVCPFRIEF